MPCCSNDIHLWETWTWKRSRLLADGEVKVRRGRCSGTAWHRIHGNAFLSLNCRSQALAWNSSGDTLYAVILLDHKPVLSIFKDPLALAPPPAHERTKPVPRDISVRSLGRWEAAREYRALMETEETLSSAVVVDFELVRSVPLLKECRGLKVNHPIIAVASEVVAVGVPSDADTTMTLAVVDTVTNQTRYAVPCGPCPFSTLSLHLTRQQVTSCSAHCWSSSGHASRHRRQPTSLGRPSHAGRNTSLVGVYPFVIGNVTIGMHLAAIAKITSNVLITSKKTIHFTGTRRAVAPAESLSLLRVGSRP